MKMIALLALPLLGLSMIGCSNDSGSSSPAASSYNDVKGSDLTAADRAFLAKLRTSAEAFGAISKSSKRSEDASPTGISGRRLELGCTSPRIMHDEFWELGDSSVPEGTIGAKKFIIDDTTTSYDLTTGADITCDEFRTNASSRDVFRQAMQEGDLLTTSMGGTFIMEQQGEFDYLNPEPSANVKLIFTVNMKGTIKYVNGFTLDLDSAYVHEVEDLANPDDEARNMEAYYHVNFVGTAYSSGMRYNKATDVLEGDIVRGNERIGTMKVFRDDRMEVLDLDGKAIVP